MYRGISDPGMGSHRPRDALALRAIPGKSAIGRWGWGFHTVRGGFDPGDHRFRPQDIGVLKVWIYNPGMGTYPPRGALALRTIPSKSAIGQCAGAWLSTPCGAVSTRGICVFVPRLSEF